MKTVRKSKRKYFIWALVVILAVFLIGFGSYRIFLHKPAAPTTTDGKPVNLNPATTEEKTQTDAQKDAIIDDKAQVTGNPSGSSKQSAIIITEATGNGVRAYVTGVFEEGGTCTASATKGTQVVTGASEGFQNASYTQCAPINWSPPLSTGSWTIKVTYKSATTESTQSKTIEVK